MSAIGDVVVFGAGGLLGTPLCALLEKRGVVRGLKHSECDITDERRVREVLGAARPGVVINCAAFTKVDDCEARAEEALRVNGVGAGNVARAAREVGARVVQVSTDYVFDGKKAGAYVEDDPTGPEEVLSSYGRSKLAGERAVIEAGGAWLIVRTSWVFGPSGPNFVATILKAARERPELRVVNDQRGRPTYAPDLAGAILSLIEAGAGGVVHAANAGACTWYEFACEIVRRAGLTATVRPCTTAEYPRPARRPANSELDTARLERLSGGTMRGWSDALAEYLCVYDQT